MTIPTPDALEAAWQRFDDAELIGCSDRDIFMAGYRAALRDQAYSPDADEPAGEPDALEKRIQEIEDDADTLRRKLIQLRYGLRAAPAAPPRNPNREMISAGNAAYVEQSGLPGPEGLPIGAYRAIWQAMLDAALSRGDGGTEK